MLDVLTMGRASAALIASIVHYGEYSIAEIKAYLSRSGCKMRSLASSPP
jgi:cyclase